MLSIKDIQAKATTEQNIRLTSHSSKDAEGINDKSSSVISGKVTA